MNEIETVGEKYLITLEDVVEFQMLVEKEIKTFKEWLKQPNLAQEDEKTFTERIEELEKMNLRLRRVLHMKV